MRPPALPHPPHSIALPVLRFCDAIVPGATPVYVRVAAPKGNVENECVSNVKRCIAANGGSTVFGWALWELSGILLEAEFHTVWRMTTGELCDVNPRPLPVEQILFLADPRLTDDGRQVRNRFLALNKSPSVQEHIKVANEIFEVMNKGDRADQFGAISLSQKEVLPLFERRDRAMLAIATSTPERNDPCRCGSWKKFKNCCGR